MNHEIANIEPGRIITAAPSAEEQAALFELQQRKAKAYSASTLVPKDYQGNPANVIIAMNIANRLDADELMVMQNLHIIHGKPGWSGQFLIACLNQCGKYGTIRYVVSKDKDGKTFAVKATAKDKATGEIVEGPEVTWDMAVKEGWTKKAGSKWMTMRDVMFRYRAAAFFVRTICPEIALGLPLADEQREVAEAPPQVSTDAMEQMRRQLAETVVPASGGVDGSADVDAEPQVTIWDDAMKAATTTAEVLEILSEADASDEPQIAKDAIAEWGREKLKAFRDAGV